MNRHRFLDALGARDVFPWEAIQTCLHHPDDCIPAFLLILEREARGLALSETEEQALFFGVHILAALRVSDAYAPLADICCKTPERANSLFQDALGDSIPKVLMALGAGKAEAAWSCVSSPKPDWVIREAFLRHWTFEALQERVPALTVLERLRNFPGKVAPAPDNYLWAGWMSAIADLGLTELHPLVQNLFDTGHIAKDEFGYLPVDRAAFAEDLTEALRLRNQGPIAHAQWAQDKGYLPFAADRNAFLGAARHILPLLDERGTRRPYPAPLLRVAEPDEDFTP